MTKAIPAQIQKHRYGNILKKIWKRPHTENRMWLSTACGAPGTGKSWAMLYLAKLLDPDFSINQVAFSPLQFTRLVAGDLKRGSVIILDDAGLALFSREAMSRAVRELSKTLQSVRYKNYIILLTLPAFLLLDKSARLLSNGYFEILKIDYAKRQSIIKFYWLQSNPHTGKVYRHSPKKVVWKDSPSGRVRSVVVMPTIRFEEPPKDLRLKYEASRKSYMDSRLNESVAVLEKLEQPKKKLLTFNEALALARKTPKKFMKGKWFDAILLMEGLGVGQSSALRLKKALQRD